MATSWPPRLLSSQLWLSFLLCLSQLDHSLRRNLAEAPLWHPCLIVLDRCVTNSLNMSPQPPCHQLNESGVNETSLVFKVNLFMLCFCMWSVWHWGFEFLVLSWQSQFFAICLSVFLLFSILLVLSFVFLQSVVCSTNCSMSFNLSVVHSVVRSTCMILSVIYSVCLPFTWSFVVCLLFDWLFILILYLDLFYSVCH